MIDREKVIEKLDEVREYIMKKVNDIASRKCRMVDKVNDAIAMLKEQEEPELCERCGRLRLKSKWESR